MSYGVRIEPLLPAVPRRADHPGRRPLDNRKVPCEILFVLYTEIPWEFLPQEPGFGSGMTCWRRLRDWHQAGVWQQVHEALLAELNASGTAPGPSSSCTPVLSDRGFDAFIRRATGVPS